MLWKRETLRGRLEGVAEAGTFEDLQEEGFEVHGAHDHPGPDDPRDRVDAEGVLRRGGADANDFTNTDKSAWTVVYSGGTLAVSSAGVFTLPAGITSFTVKIPTTSDAVYEGAESFTLTANATSAYITDTDTASGSITDDGSGSDGDDGNDFEMLLAREVAVKQPRLKLAAAVGASAGGQVGGTGAAASMMRCCRAVGASMVDKCWAVECLGALRDLR